MALGRTSVINLAGSALPLLVSIPAVGALARLLDGERFSLVLLAWALVGFAGVFDLGLSRAVVRQVAVERNDPAALAETLCSAASAVAVLGSVAALLVILLRQPLLGALDISPAVRSDAATGLALAALSLPLLLPALVLQSHWDGVEDFVEANLQRTFAGCLVPLLSLVCTWWQPDFSTPMAGLLAARALALALALGRRDMFSRLRNARPRAACLVRLLRYGGWVTLSNTISPLMNTLDRYLLGFVRGAAVVGYYAAPSDAASKLLVVPVAVTRGLFPALVRAPDVANAAALSREAHRLVAMYCIPLAVTGALAAELVLQLWLGDRFAAASATALQLLMVGFLFGAFAQVPFTEVQARGRADLSAWLHLLELGPFVVTAWWLASKYGVNGAAAAWSLRNAADLVLHSWAVGALRRGSEK